MHRGQRGTGVTKAWRGVRRKEPLKTLGRRAIREGGHIGVSGESARGFMSRVGFAGFVLRKAQNIAHRSDLAPLCIFQTKGRA
jgi:hypothetical protein